jgi:hypothetical protein
MRSEIVGSRIGPQGSSDFGAAIGTEKSRKGEKVAFVRPRTQSDRSIGHRGSGRRCTNEVEVPIRAHELIRWDRPFRDRTVELDTSLASALE